MKEIVFVAVLSTLIMAGCDSQQQDKASGKAEPIKTEVVQSTTDMPEAMVTQSTVPAEPVAVKADVVEKTPVKAAMTGEQVYKKSCIGCHASGAAGAPKLGDASVWKARIDKGMTTLYSSALKGVPGTAMMPKGTCAACSEVELNAAVDYMVSKVK